MQRAEAFENGDVARVGVDRGARLGRSGEAFGVFGERVGASEVPVASEIRSTLLRVPCDR